MVNGPGTAVPFQHFPAAFELARCRHQFGAREYSKVMRCAMPPSTPCCTHAPSRLTSCISQLCVASGMAPKISAAVLSHRLHRLISHRPMSHRLIVSSSHRRIAASPHLFTAVTLSHLRTAVTSSHHPIISSSHITRRPIVASSHHPILEHHQ